MTAPGWPPASSTAPNAPIRCSSPAGDRGPVRAFAAAQARLAGLSAGRARDLVIAVSELAANTWRHTDAGGTLHIWAADAEVLCQVHDSGHVSDPLAGRRRPIPEAGNGH